MKSTIESELFRARNKYCIVSPAIYNIDSLERCFMQSSEFYQVPILIRTHFDGSKTADYKYWYDQFSYEYPKAKIYFCVDQVASYEEAVKSCQLEADVISLADKLSFCSKNISAVREIVQLCKASNIMVEVPILANASLQAAYKQILNTQIDILRILTKKPVGEDIFQTFSEIISKTVENTGCLIALNESSLLNNVNETDIKTKIQVFNVNASLSDAVVNKARDFIDTHPDYKQRNYIMLAEETMLNEYMNVMKSKLIQYGNFARRHMG